MLNLRLIIALIITSFCFSCGPSKLEQTVAEGKRKLEERQEQDRIKAQADRGRSRKALPAGSGRNKSPKGTRG